MDDRCFTATRVGLSLAIFLLISACDRSRSRDAAGARSRDTPAGQPPAIPPAEPATARQIMRELTFTTDPTTGMPRGIRARPSVDVPVESFWKRYQPIFDVPVAELVPTGPGRDSSTAPGHLLTSYQQVHLGYPVAGCGYLVDSEKGFFRAANGKVMPGLPGVLPRPIDRPTALAAALRYLKIDGPPPWEAAPAPGGSLAAPRPLRHPPEASLVLWTGRLNPVGADFFLTWVFRFAGTGLSEPATLEMDAVTARVLSTSPGHIR